MRGEMPDDRQNRRDGKPLQVWVSGHEALALGQC